MDDKQKIDTETKETIENSKRMVEHTKELVSRLKEDIDRQEKLLARERDDLKRLRSGNVILVHLPQTGIRGNTHFPMSDLNNIEIADLMSKFLKEKGLD